MWGNGEERRQGAETKTDTKKKKGEKDKIIIYSFYIPQYSMATSVIWRIIPDTITCREVVLVESINQQEIFIITCCSFTKLTITIEKSGVVGLICRQIYLIP